MRTFPVWSRAAWIGLMGMGEANVLNIPVGCGLEVWPGCSGFDGALAPPPPHPARETEIKRTSPAINFWFVLITLKVSSPTANLLFKSDGRTEPGAIIQLVRSRPEGR